MDIVIFDHVSYRLYKKSISRFVVGVIVVVSARSLDVVERIQINPLRLKELRHLFLISHLVLRPRFHHEDVVSPHVRRLL